MVRRISGEVQLICSEVLQRLCKDCGEVVKNWVVNLRRAITHAQLQAVCS